ncbi:hypothetical protein IWQ61_000733 [Dispira simplex]|nr:hypothetical protein IWQ61_000733 [Dispira simplex]
MFFRKKTGLATSTARTDKVSNKNANRLGPGTGLNIKSLAKASGKKGAANNQSQLPLSSSSGESINTPFAAGPSPPLSPVQKVSLVPPGVGQRQHVSPFIRLNQATTQFVDSSAELSVAPDNFLLSSGPETSMTRASTLPIHSSGPLTPHAHGSPRLTASVAYHGSGAGYATSVPDHISLPSQSSNLFNLFSSGVTSSTMVNEICDSGSIRDKSTVSSAIGANDASGRSRIPLASSMHQSAVSHTGPLRSEPLNRESDNGRPTLLGDILGSLDISQPPEIPNSRPTEPVSAAQPINKLSEFDRWIMGVETGQTPTSLLSDSVVSTPRTTPEITSVARSVLLSKKEAGQLDEIVRSPFPMPLLNFDGPGSNIDLKELHITGEQERVSEGTNADITSGDIKPVNTNMKSKSRSSHWLSGLLPTKGSKKCHRELPPEKPEELTLSLDLGIDTTFANVVNDLVESKTTQIEDEIELALQDNTSALSQFLVRNIPPTCNTSTSFRELPSGQMQAISALTELLRHKGATVAHPAMNNSDVEDSETDGNELSEGGYSDDESGPDTPGGGKKRTKQAKKGVSWNLPDSRASESDQIKQATSAFDLAKDQERKLREQEKEKERALLQRMLDRHRNEILKGHGAIHNWMVNSGINPSALFDEPGKPVEESSPPVNAKYRSISNPFTVPGVEDPGQPYFRNPYGNPSGGGHLMLHSNRSGGNVNTASSFGATFTRRNYSAQALPTFPLTNLPPCPPPPNLHMAYNGAVNPHYGSPGIPSSFIDSQVSVMREVESDSELNTTRSNTYVSPLLFHANRQHISSFHPTNIRSPYQEYNPGVSSSMTHQTYPTVHDGESIGQCPEVGTTPEINPPVPSGSTKSSPSPFNSKSITSSEDVSAFTDPASKSAPDQESRGLRSSDESDEDGEGNGYVDFQKKANSLARPIVMAKEPDPPVISPTEMKRRFKTNFKHTSSDVRAHAGVYSSTFNSVGTPVALPNAILAKRKQEEEERRLAEAREAAEQKEKQRKAKATTTKTTRRQRKEDNNDNGNSDEYSSGEYSETDSGSYSCESESSVDEAATTQPLGPFVPGLPYYGCFPTPPGMYGYPPNGGMMPAPGYYSVYPMMATSPGAFAMPPSLEGEPSASSTVLSKGNPSTSAPRSLKDLIPPPSVTKTKSLQKASNAVRYPLDSSDDSDESDDESEEKKIAPTVSSTMHPIPGTVPASGYAHPYTMTNAVHPHLAMFAAGNRPPMVYPSTARLNPGHPLLPTTGSPTTSVGHTAWPFSSMSPVTSQSVHPSVPPTHGLPRPNANMGMQSGINQSYLLSGPMNGADTGYHPPTRNGFPQDKRHPPHFSPRAYGAGNAPAHPTMQRPTYYTKMHPVTTHHRR